MTAVGAASPRAQGQATTSTEIALIKLKVMLLWRSDSGRPSRCTAPQPRSNSHRTKVARLRTRTVGTKRLETRSANSCTGARCAWAASTRPTIWAKAELSPTASSRTWSCPPWLAVPPTTWSPGPFATGSDSPVNADSSTADSPDSTTPSAGTFAPGNTRTRSPFKSSFASTGRSRAVETEPGSSRTSSAACGCRARSAVIASPVLPFARHSSHFPRSTNVINREDVSKSRHMAASCPCTSLLPSSRQEDR
mmetsp:Transcript_72277/g.169208  ORF Transcript_72277/g.169208 Transcript_72277/m.169208 type:complete len:251 (-) Transcript_72277:1189-1941(-)